MVSKLVKRFIASIFVLLAMNSVEIFSMEPPISIRNVWSDDAEVRSDRIMQLCGVYEQYDGFIQWKADFDYLISSDFLNDLIENHIFDLKYESLLGTWIDSGIYTGGYDDDRWPENNRDIAARCMNEMISVYHMRFYDLDDGEFKNSIFLFIKRMSCLKTAFSEITFYGGDEPVTYKKTISETTGDTQSL